MFPNNKNLIYGFSKKKDGNMRLNGTGTKENRKIFFNSIGFDVSEVVSAGLSHGSKVAKISNKNIGQIIKNTDGLVTTEKNILLAITIADCVPIYFLYPEKEIIGIAHVGWRGLSNGIIENMWQTLNSDFGVLANDLLVYLGPHIKGCHYEVGTDVYDHFFEIPGAVEKRDNKTFLNLSYVVKYILISHGVKKNNIKICDNCTYCEKNKYFSFRRDKPKAVQAMIAYIGLK